MRQSYLVGEAARHIKAGRLDKGHDRLIQFLKANDGAAPPEVFAMLADLAKTFPQAAVNLAVSHLMGQAPEPTPGEAKRLLESAAASDNVAAAAHAHYRLALIHMGEYGSPPDTPAAVMHFRECYDRCEDQDDMEEGPGAAFSLGMIYMVGAEGVEKDLGEAAKWLGIASEYEHPDACVALALMILKKEADGETEEALELLDTAAEDGNEEALSMLELFEGRDLEEIEAIIRAGLEGEKFEPTKIPPADPNRPRLVADAIVNELGAPRDIAEVVTASFYGYGSLKEAISAAGSGEGEPPDEDCDAETVKKRRQRQVASLLRAAQMEQDAAEIVIDLLRPTCRLGRPSLASLEERMQNRLFPFSSDQMSDALASFFKRHGIEGNPADVMNSFRTMMPIDPDVWLGVMEQYLGWKFTDENLDAEGNGALVAKAVGKGKKKIPVFMSPVGYLPGDNADVAVSDVKKAIQSSESLAVLVFNKPLIWLDRKDKKRRGLLYGGQILKDDRWSDFVLRPKGGVDDALSQSGQMAPVPSVQFFETYSFDFAAELGVAIAAAQKGCEPDEVEATLISTPSGWAQLMVSPSQPRRSAR